MNILHCIIDEKFIDGVIEVCKIKLSKHNHDFIIFTKSTSTQLKYIKNTNLVRFEKISNFIEIANSGKYNVVVAHSLASIPLLELYKIDQHIKFVWFAWGFDLYTAPNEKIPFINIQLYHKHTKKLIQPSLKLWMQKKHAYLHTLFHLYQIKKSINRVDYFSGIIPEEYDLMAKNDFFRAKKVQFHYMSLNSCTENEIVNSLETTDILVGNSGDPTNNHADAFDIIRQCNIGNSKVIVPLSYGGSQDYISKIIRLGYEYFGNNFIPLTKFLARDEYFKTVQSCRNVIMFHERQQAVGNTDNAIKTGCKLFLSETSMLYSYYQKKGIKIFSLQNDFEKQFSHFFDSKANIKLCNETITDRTKNLNHISETFQTIENDILTNS